VTERTWPDQKMNPAEAGIFYQEMPALPLICT